MPDTSASPPTRTRDAERTAAAIYEAAAAEFAEHGYEGARVDVIAARSGVNKRMIYIYYGDKKGLYLEILRRKVLAMHEVFTADWGSGQTPADNLVSYFQGTAAERELLRFVQWEALEVEPDEPVVAEDERVSMFEEKVDAIRKAQKLGGIDADIDPQYIMLVFMALSAYPIAFSQNTRMVTGLSADDPRFQKKWSSVLRTIADALSGD
jgi:TetR/AcrR family transcriptional regulator